MSKPEQLALVRLDHLEERPELLAEIEARPVCTEGRRYRHTGRRFLKKLLDDGNLAEFVLEGFRSGMSARLLAMRCGVAPVTLARARALLTERGELIPVRTRIDRLLDDFVEEGIEYCLEGMRNGVTHPGQLSIPVLAAYDKRSQRDAGLVPGTERTREEIDAAKVLAALVVFEACAGVASGGKATVCEANGHALPEDTGQDTDLALLESAPAAALALAPPAPTAAEPMGGGIGLAGRRKSGEGSGRSFCRAKASAPSPRPSPPMGARELAIRIFTGLKDPFHHVEPDQQTFAGAWGDA